MLGCSLHTFFMSFAFFSLLSHINIILSGTSNIYYKSNSKDVPYSCLIILMLELSTLYILPSFLSLTNILYKSNSKLSLRAINYFLVQVNMINKKLFVTPFRKTKACPLLVYSLYSEPLFFCPISLNLYNSFSDCLRMVFLSVRFLITGRNIPI